MHSVSQEQGIYRALVLPVLDYASTAWNPHTQKHISWPALETIQNCGACWVCGSRYSCHSHTWPKSSSDCCQVLHWPSLSTHRMYLTSTIYFIVILYLLALSSYLQQDHPPSLYNVNSLQLTLIGFPFCQ